MKTSTGITVTTLAAALAFGLSCGTAFAAPQTTPPRQTTPQQTTPQQQTQPPRQFTPPQQTTPMRQHPMNPMQAGNSVKITAAVKHNLSQVKGVNIMAVTVTVSNGTVTLVGSVPSKAVRKEAIAAARSVQGVKKVDASRLKSNGSGM